MDNNYGNNDGMNYTNQPQNMYGQQNTYGNPYDGGMQSTYGNPYDGGAQATYGNQYNGGQQTTNNPFEAATQNTYNPYGNQPQGSYEQPENNRPRRKRRSGLASFLCAILGIALLATGILVSLKTGIFADGVIASIVEKSKVMDTIKEEVKEEMKMEFTESVNKELDKTFDKMIDYVEDSLVTGEVPDKEVIKEDMSEAYNSIYDAVSKDILDELQAKGEISIDEIKNLEAGKMIADALGEDEFDKLTEELKVEYGNTIEVSEDNRAEIEEIIDENRDSAEVKKHLDEAVDSIHSSLTEVSEELKGSGEDSINVFELLQDITNTVDMGFIIAVAVALVLIILVFVIDRDISMSLRGMFGPLFAPGAIILILSIAAGKLYSILVEEYKAEQHAEEIDIIGVLETMGDVVINPFMIVGITMVVGAILFKIVGVILGKRNN